MLLLYHAQYTYVCRDIQFTTSGLDESGDIRVQLLLSESELRCNGV